MHTGAESETTMGRRVDGVGGGVVDVLPHTSRRYGLTSGQTFSSWWVRGVKII